MIWRYVVILGNTPITAHDNQHKRNGRHYGAYNFGKRSYFVRQNVPKQRAMMVRVTLRITSTVNLFLSCRQMYCEAHPPFILNIHLRIPVNFWPQQMSSHFLRMDNIQSSRLITGDLRNTRLTVNAQMNGLAYVASCPNLHFLRIESE